MQKNNVIPFSRAPRSMFTPGYCLEWGVSYLRKTLAKREYYPDAGAWEYLKFQCSPWLIAEKVGDMACCEITVQEDANGRVPFQLTEYMAETFFGDRVNIPGLPLPRVIKHSEVNPKAMAIIRFTPEVLGEIFLDRQYNREFQIWNGIGWTMISGILHTVRKVTFHFYQKSKLSKGQV